MHLSINWKALLLSLASLGCATASDANQWLFASNNDIAFGSDGDYTNGVRLTYAHESASLPLFSQWQSRLMWPTTTAQKAWGLTLSQDLWTPAEIEISTPQPTMRPYAAWLYVESYTASYQSDLAQKNWISLGVIGPKAGGEKTQRSVHRWTGSTPPLGWAHQIQSQVTLQWQYELDKLFWRKDFVSNYQWEISGFNLTTIGNMRTQTQFGINLRAGAGLASSFGRLSSQYGQFYHLHGPAGLSGYLQAFMRARLYDATIAGKLPYSHELKIKPEQISFSSGLIWRQNDWAISLGVHLYSREYRSDHDPWHGYGSLQLSWLI